jgi:hypothetical protein
MKKTLLLVAGLAAGFAAVNVRADFVGWYANKPGASSYPYSTSASGPVGNWTLDLGGPATDSFYFAASAKQIALNGSDNSSTLLTFTIPVQLLAYENGFTFQYTGGTGAGESFGYLVNGTQHTLFGPNAGGSFPVSVLGLTTGDTFGFWEQSAGNSAPLNITISKFATVPEPSMIAMNLVVAGLGAAGIAWRVRRAKK